MSKAAAMGSRRFFTNLQRTRTRSRKGIPLTRADAVAAGFRPGSYEYSGACMHERMAEERRNLLAKEEAERAAHRRTCEVRMVQVHTMRQPMLVCVLLLFRPPTWMQVTVRWVGGKARMYE